MASHQASSRPLSRQKCARSLFQTAFFELTENMCALEDGLIRAQFGLDSSTWEVTGFCKEQELLETLMPSGHIAFGAQVTK